MYKKLAIGFGLVATGSRHNDSSKIGRDAARQLVRNELIQLVALSKCSTVGSISAECIGLTKRALGRRNGFQKLNKSSLVDTQKQILNKRR